MWFERDIGLMTKPVSTQQITGLGLGLASLALVLMLVLQLWSWSYSFGLIDKQDQDFEQSIV